MSMSVHIRNVISVLEFQRSWVLNSRMFGQTSTENSKENKLYFVNALNDSSSKIGPDFRNKVCQKLILTKNVLLTKLTSNLLFLIEKKIRKICMRIIQ